MVKNSPSKLVGPPAPWVMIDDRWAAMRPEIYGALLQFLARGLIA